MAMKIKIELIKKEMVKPSFPTSESCGRYELSALDQFIKHFPFSVLLFYPATTALSGPPVTSQILVKSLSKTLTSFYHFAGRLRDNIGVDCNDEGAEFVTTRVNCPLSTLLSKPDLDTLGEFLPDKTFPEGELSGRSSPLLLVKANFFNCGGLALGVSLVHKIGDMSTLTAFLNAWAFATVRSEIEPGLIPHFISSTSVFPPLEPSLFSGELPKIIDSAEEKYKSQRLVSQRLIFDRPRIEALKSKAATDSSVPNPTRVEAVLAQIWKCAIEALPESSRYSEYSLFQPMNIRKRMNPCLPENTVGNLMVFFQTKILKSREQEKPELKDLTVPLRKAIDELKVIWKEGIPAGALSGYLEAAQMNDSGHQFMATSWCRFALYDTDFGWGKPVWICSPDTKFCIIMDTRDGEGVEMAMWLGEDDMKRFETNPELLAFASLNPAIII